jgi:hypothetical protein
MCHCISYVCVHILSIRYRYQAITGAAGSGSDAYTYIPPTIRYIHIHDTFTYTAQLHIHV